VIQDPLGNELIDAEPAEEGAARPPQVMGDEFVDTEFLESPLAPPDASG
jgi:hypothetical protein